MFMKNRKLALSLITAGVLAGVLMQTVGAQGLTRVDCNTKLNSGKTYHTYHQGPDLGFTGAIDIKHTYKCQKGTCFQAIMNFDNYGPDQDKAEGYWQGSTIQFTRHVSRDNSTQNWSGQCLANSVRGEWNFISPSQPSNKGLAAITY